jgi:hypothetical protein
MVVFFIAYRDHASMRDFAHYVLELDRRVIYFEILMEPGFHVTQDSFAHRRRNVFD